MRSTRPLRRCSATSSARCGIPCGSPRRWCAGVGGSAGRARMRPRGTDEFVAVGWDEVLDRLAAELLRVYGGPGPEAVFGGSYGWSSAGRFHHAQSQVHRFLEQPRRLRPLAEHLQRRHVRGGAPADLRPPRRPAAPLTAWPLIAAHTELLVCFGGIPAKNLAVAPGGVTEHRSVAHLTEMVRRGGEVVLGGPGPGRPARRAPRPVAAAAARHRRRADAGAVPGFGRRGPARRRLPRDALRGRRRGARLPRRQHRRRREVPAVGGGRSAGCPRTRSSRWRGRWRPGTRWCTVSWSLQRAEHGEQPVWAGVLLAALLGRIGLPGAGFGHGYGSMADSRGADQRRSARRRCRSWSTRCAPPSRSRGSPTCCCRRAPPTPTTASATATRTSSSCTGAAATRSTTTRTSPGCAGRSGREHGGRPRAVLDGHRPARRRRPARDRHAGARRHRRRAHRPVPHRHAPARAAVRARPATTTPSSPRWPSGWVRARRSPRGATPRPGCGTSTSSGASATAGRAPTSTRSGAAGRVALDRPPPRAFLADFRADPAAHPLATPSGRIELHSATIAAYGLADCPGHPAWLEPGEWHGAARAAAYPLVLLANNPSARLHSQLDFGPHSAASKVAGREPLRMHPDDAAARGLADGRPGARVQRPRRLPRGPARVRRPAAGRGADVDGRLVLAGR